MKVTTTSFTVAEYCEQMLTKAIVVNRGYQRSPKIWPQAARSFLIDSILLGFPLPKLSLFQTTDLRTKKTSKEIVDGQQRSQAIYDFFTGKLSLTSRSSFQGHRFETLDPPIQQNFLEYQLSVDVFVGATEADIRQAFYRINSYNVPLNKQEIRHATFQGQFKWFIYEMASKYGGALKKLGTFTDAKLVRMKDAHFLAELCLAMIKGIPDAAESKLDALYKENDAAFPQEAAIGRRVDETFDCILGLEALHSTAFMRPYLLYSLFLAITHARAPLDALHGDHPRYSSVSVDSSSVEALSNLAAALENPEQYPDLTSFVDACSSSTQRLQNRRVRFQEISKALGDGT